jgi:hypothetical protein
VSRRRPVSWNECTAIREDLNERVDPRAQTNSARRRRSLHRGMTRWIRDVNADGVPVHRVLLVALTVTDTDPEVAKGAMENVMHDLRDLASARHSSATRLASSFSARRYAGAKSVALTRRGPAGRAGSAQTRHAVHGLEELAQLDGCVVEHRGPSGEPAGHVQRRRVARGVEVHGAPLEQISLHQPQLMDVLSVGEARVGHGPILPYKPTHVKSDRHNVERPPERLRYSWWAEFQARGAIHYHAMIVDPPFNFERDARHWFDAHWGLAGIQTWVEWRSGAWFQKSAGDYALKDVRKLNGKHYEQDYTRMPKGWRTFSTHRLTFAAAEHQEHETKAFTVCVAKPDTPWYERQKEIYIYRVDHHVPGRCGCRLTRRKRPLQAASYNGRAADRSQVPVDRGRPGVALLAGHATAPSRGAGIARTPKPAADPGLELALRDPVACMFGNGFNKAVPNPTRRDREMVTPDGA